MASRKKEAKTKKSGFEKIPAQIYRGVRIQPIEGVSNFTRDEIRKAVETAIAKHAHALAGRD